MRCKRSTQIIEKPLWNFHLTLNHLQHPKMKLYEREFLHIGKNYVSYKKKIGFLLEDFLPH